MAAMATMPLGRLLGIAGRLISGRFEKILDDRGVSHTGWVVLLKLEETDDLTQGDVAERCFVRPATLTSVVDALEAAGWLTRTRDVADRRVVRLRLTDSGRTHVAATRQVMQQRMAPAFADMSAKDEAVVRRFLTAVITQLSHPDAKGPHDSER
jgi:DNA-binding MarR family transcriptional regulator